VEDGLNDQVKKDAFEVGGLKGDPSHEDVAQMRHAGVGQEALYAVLS